MSCRARWALFGAAFGVCFPVMATGIRWAQVGADGVASAYRSDPLLWIILTAPLFLGAFAALGGHQHDGLRALSAELDDKVKERTAELAALAARLGLVLDAIGDALLTMRLDGTLDGSPSSHGLQWFGPIDSGADIARWLAPDDERFRVALTMGLEQIRDDILPLELTLDQLPRAFSRNGRHYAVDVRVIDAAADGERRLLLVVRDVTAAVEHEADKAIRAEQIAIVARALRDPAGFRVFCDDSHRIVQEARASDDEALVRHHVHTLKGNAAVYGFSRLAAACQALEDEFAEQGHARFVGAAADHVVDVFRESLEGVSPFVVDDGDIVRVPREEVLSLLDAIEGDVPRNELLDRVHDWSLEPLWPLFERLGAHGERVAARLGRQVQVRGDDGGVRVDLHRHAAFFASLVHVVRNAIDHGIEPPEERLAAGKPAVGSLVLQARDDGDGVRLNIRDDGRGIQWDRVEQTARRMGLACATPDERVAALCHDGLTTAATITEFSGRGVGLGAVYAACKSLGISMSVDTEPGRSTTFSFLLPAARRSLRVIPGATAEPALRRVVS